MAPKQQPPQGEAATEQASSKRGGRRNRRARNGNLSASSETLLSTSDSVPSLAGDQSRGDYWAAGTNRNMQHGPSSSMNQSGQSMSSLGGSSDLGGGPLPSVDEHQELRGGESSGSINNHSEPNFSREAAFLRRASQRAMERKMSLQGVPGELGPECSRIGSSQHSYSSAASSRRSFRRGRKKASSASLLSELHDTVRSERQAPGHLQTSRLEFAHNQSTSTSSMFSVYKKPAIEVKGESDSRFRKFRLLCGNMVETPWVQLAIVFLIVLNGITLGIATFDWVTENPEVDAGFAKLDRTFLCIFTVELVLQLIYRGSTYFQDGWLIFDFVVVVGSWSLEQLQIIRALRIFRVFRLVTRIGPLRELVMALGQVMPRLSAIAMLLCLIFYIYAVLFTQLFSHMELSDNYFGTLDASLFTMFEMMTMEWAGIVREVMAEESWAWFPLVSFISTTGFIAFNLIIAVVCDAVSMVDKQVQAEKDKLEHEQDGNEEAKTEDEEVSLMESMERRVQELSKQVIYMRSRNAESSRAIAGLTSLWNQQLHHMQSVEEHYQQEMEKLKKAHMEEKEAWKKAHMKEKEAWKKSHVEKETRKRQLPAIPALSEARDKVPKENEARKKEPVSPASPASQGETLMHSYRMGLFRQSPTNDDEDDEGNNVSRSLRAMVMQQDGAIETVSRERGPRRPRNATGSPIPSSYSSISSGEVTYFL